MARLIYGEISLTLHILLGIILGEVIMRYHLPEKFFSRIAKYLRINSVTALAAASAFASSQTGAAILSSALSHGQISEHCAVWSVLLLSLPAYLKRWPSTFFLSVSMAGKIGAVYALTMLAITIGRFLIAYTFVKSEDISSSSLQHSSLSNKIPSLKSYAKKLLSLLPAAWLCYGAAYLLVPMLNSHLKDIFSGSILPLSGWTVAASAIVRVNASLALINGYLASGNLTVHQAVFALLLGSGLGTITRILRMNAGYYFGFFPLRIARKMLLLNYLTITPLVLISILIAYLCL